METKRMAIYDGTYLLVETDNPNVFVFYREDMQTLGDYGTKPLEMYQALITNKMKNGEIPAKVVAKNIFYEDVEDYKALRLWVYTVGEEPDFFKNLMHMSGPESSRLN